MKYLDIQKLSGYDPNILIKEEEKREKKEEASSFDRLHGNVLDLIVQIVEKGKDLEEENECLNRQIEYALAVLEETKSENRKLADKYHKLKLEYRELTEENRKLTEENRKLREECHQHKESTLCLADELARHKQENKRLKQSIEALPVIPQTRNATHAQHVEYNVFHPGAMQFKDGQMSGSRFQCSSSSAEQDAYDLKI